MNDATPTPARRYTWPPFEEGNQAAVRHGAYATVALGPRVDELAELLRESVPAYSPSDEVAVRLLGLALARLEAAGTAIEGATPGDLARLRADERGWVNTARRLLGDLGMTPTSRARLGLDLTRGTTLAAAMEEALAARDRVDRRMTRTTEEDA